MGVIGWLVAIGCLLIGSAIGIWGLTETNRTILIWIMGVPGAILVVIGGGLELQNFAVPGAPRNDAEISQKQLRAYIGIASFSMEDQKDIPEIIVVVSNSGATPARQIEGFIQWLWYKGEGREIPDDFEYPVASRNGDKTVFTLNPGGSQKIVFPIGDDKVSGKTMIEAARLGVVTLYFYGIVQYVDAFGKSASSEFCYKFIPNAPVGGRRFLTWGPHNKNN